MQIMQTLENHYKDLCDIEFTIERGKLWMLQTRVGKRTAAAAFRIATQLVDQGLIDLDEALTRVSRRQLAQLMFPRFDTSGDVTRDRQGDQRVAGRGGRQGRLRLRRRPWRAARRGEHVILIRRETNPDDLHGMIAAAGHPHQPRRQDRHAAVVARGMGKTCVCGAEELEVDTKAKRFTAPGGVDVSEGDVISIDGTTGEVYLGEVPVVASKVVQYFEGELASDTDELVGAVHTIMAHADASAGSACARTPTTARTARGPAEFGAEGIGLCRTEHMFLGERRRARASA